MPNLKSVKRDYDDSVRLNEGVSKIWYRNGSKRVIIRLEYGRFNEFRWPDGAGSFRDRLVHSRYRFPHEGCTRLNWKVNVLQTWIVISS